MSGYLYCVASYACGCTELYAFVSNYFEVILLSNYSCIFILKETFLYEIWEAFGEITAVCNHHLTLTF